MAVFFNGRKLVTPTTASVVNDDAMQNQNLTVGNVLCLVGKASGGKPKTALSFGSPEQAKATLRKGELLDAVIAAFDPSAETGAPSTVVAVRVNPATQAALALVDATDVAVVNLKPVNYGLEDNKIKVKVESGTLSGKRITVQMESAYYTGDNIGRAALSVLYTGAETAATMTVTATTLTLAVPGDTEAPSTAIALSEFETVGALVDKINSLGDFTAIVLDSSDNVPTMGGLDFSAAVSIKTVATVRADLQAIVDWFNNFGQPLLIAERVASVGTVPKNAPFAFLAGGSEGTTIVSDWQDAFNAIQTVNVQWLTPISGDPAMHDMVDAHVAYCSGTLRRERRAICGTPAGTTDEAVKPLAKSLNSDRTSLVHLGYYAYNSAGKLVLRPPYMTAALIAAAFAGVNPGTPLTNKTLKVSGWERDLLNPTDTDPLIEAGVLCLENTEQGYKVVQSITTWLGNDKYNKVEQSTGAALDFTVRNVRQAVDIYRGRKGDPLLLSKVVSTAQSTLKELARTEDEGGPGVLAGDANSPAFRNITASLEGDVTRLQFECSPVIPNNYILVTVYAVPFSGSVSA